MAHHNNHKENSRPATQPQRWRDFRRNSIATTEQQIDAGGGVTSGAIALLRRNNK